MSQYRIVKRVTPLLDPPHGLGYGVQKNHWLWGWSDVEMHTYAGGVELFFPTIEQAQAYIDWEIKKKEWVKDIKNLS